MFLNKKSDGLIKGQKCSDRRKQHNKEDQKDSSCLAVLSKAVMVTAMVYGFEEQGVAITDIPGAFLMADIDELIHMKLGGPVVLVIIDIVP